MKYIVNAEGKDVASFGKRSDALDYADLHKNVTVTRKTPRVTRVVFKRTVSEANGFITVAETATFRNQDAASK